MIVRAIFLLCSLTSVICAALLWRSFRKSRSRLLLWSSLSFGLLALANVLLFIDLAILPSIDMSLARAVLTFVGLALLVYGLVIGS